MKGEWFPGKDYIHYAVDAEEVEHPWRRPDLQCTSALSMWANSAGTTRQCVPRAKNECGGQCCTIDIHTDDDHDSVE